MIELRIALDGINYDTLIPKLIQFTIKNPIASQAALAAYNAKASKLSQKEKDALAVKLLTDNKNKILTTLNGKISDKGIIGYILGFDADLL